MMKLSLYRVMLQDLEVVYTVGEAGKLLELVAEMYDSIGYVPMAGVVCDEEGASDWWVMESLVGKLDGNDGKIGDWKFAAHSNDDNVVDMFYGSCMDSCRLPEWVVK